MSNSAVLNSQFLAKIAAGDIKGAQEASTDFTRLTLREEGLLRKILPPRKVTWADCTKQLDTDHPVLVVEKEVSQPLSVSVPFGSLPANQYIRGSRYRVDMARTHTRNFTKDKSELGGYDYDIREVFKDNAIKDHMTAEDVPFFRLVNDIIAADPTKDPSDPLYQAATQAGVTSAMTGKVQMYDFTAANKNPYGLVGFSKESVISSLTIMSRGYGDPTKSTPIRLVPDLIVMNVNTGLEFAKLLPTDIGRPLAEKMASEGLTVDTFFGKRFLFTIKDDLVKDGEMYQFAKPQFLGVFAEMEEPTLFLEDRAFMLEYFIYSMQGCSIGNAFGLAKAIFPILKN